MTPAPSATASENTLGARPLWHGSGKVEWLLLLALTSVRCPCVYLCACVSVCLCVVHHRFINLILLEKGFLSEPVEEKKASTSTVSDVE